MKQSQENRRSVAGRLVLLCAGAALLVLFVRHIGWQAIVAQLRHIGPEAAWLIVPYALGTTLSAFPWAWLLPRAQRPSVWGIIAGRFAASGANALLPFFGLAGEPARLLWLASGGRARGLAAIAMDRILYNCASALLLLSGALLGIFRAGLPPLLGEAAAAVALVILIATLLILWVGARFGVGHRVQALLSRIFGKQYTEQNFGARVDVALLELVRGPRRVLWAGLVTHFAARAVLAIEAGVALRVLDVRSNFAQDWVFGVVPVALSLFVSWVPSQLGVQEGAQSVIASALGLPAASGFALVFLQRLRQLVFAALTPLLLAASRPKARIEPASPEA